MLKVWARDGARARQGILKPLDGQVLLKRSDVGGFDLTIEGTTDAAEAFTRGWGVVVQEDDEFLFSGPATTIRREFTAGSHRLVLKGETDMHTLRDRNVYPSATLASGSQTSVTHWTRADQPGEELIVELINQHVNSAAPLSYRRTPDFPALVNLGRGATSTVSARWTTVLEEVQAVAAVAGLVVEVGQFNPGSPNLEARIRVPADLTRVVRFTPRKGLGDYWVELTEPETTTVAVGGGGQGTARTIAGYSVNDGWGGRRREKFLDRRDTALTSELQKTALEHGKETAEKSSAGFTLTETARYRLGRDFLLGDLVSVYADNEEDVELITGPVTSALLEWNGHGRTVDLRVGENVAGASDMSLSLEKTRSLERRLSRMEGGQ